MAATYTLELATLALQRIARIRIALDASYPVGGYPFNRSDCAFAVSIEACVFEPALDGAGNLLLAVFDSTTNKIRVFYPTGGATAAPATIAQPVSTLANAALPVGAVAVTSTGAQPALTMTQPSITPGAAKEVPTGANLSGYTLRGIVFGS